MVLHESETLLLGADFGTQGVRVAVFDHYGGLREMSFAAYPTVYPKPGWAEQDPLNWWSAFKQALAECLKGIKKPEKIKGMTICSTSSTVLAVDEDGNPLTRAILWMDNRAVAETEYINKSGHPRLRYSGGADSVEWMIPKTLWIKNNLQDIYRASRLVVEQQDWINHRLTARWVSSRCTATCKWNYADVDGGWSDDFMREIGLEEYRDKLPVQVVPVGDPVGVIRAEVARELGLPSGITVFQGGIDAHTGLLGLGVVEPGQMGVIMGTSFVHLTLSPVPVFLQGLWGPYPNALVDGLWLLEGGQISCGSLTKWFKDHLAADLQYSHPGDEPYRLLACEAARVPPGSDGLVVLDTWQGNRTPYRDPLATGCMWGLTLSHTRAHLYRAILESVAYGTRNILEQFSAAGLEINEIIACGGALKNPLWLQIIADVSGVPIRKAGFGEAGVLGCAICAAAGLGLYSGLTAAAQSMVKFGETVYPEPDHTRAYSFYFEQYKKTYELLAPQMHLLHTFRRNGGEDVGRN